MPLAPPVTSSNSSCSPCVMPFSVDGTKNSHLLTILTIYSFWSQSTSDPTNSSSIPVGLYMYFIALPTNTNYITILNSPINSFCPPIIDLVLTSVISFSIFPPLSLRPVPFLGGAYLKLSCGTIFMVVSVETSKLNSHMLF